MDNASERAAAEPLQHKECIYCHAWLVPGLTPSKCVCNVRSSGEPGSHVWASRVG